MFVFAVMDDHHGLDEGKHTQTEERLSRKGTRDGEHQSLLLYICISCHLLITFFELCLAKIIHFFVTCM